MKRRYRSKHARRLQRKWGCPFCRRVIEYGERFYLLVEAQRYEQAADTFPGLERRLTPPDFVCRRCRVSIEENQRDKREEELAIERDVPVIGRIFKVLFALQILLIVGGAFLRR